MKKPRLEPFPVQVPEALSTLTKLAYNLWWSWTPEAQKLFAAINHDHWQQYRNPVKLLAETSPQRLEELMRDQAFASRLGEVSRLFEAELDGHSWRSENYPDYGDKITVYLCAEFGIHECLPIYSGGLGVLAGDHTKSASDLGIPFIGIGLLYRNGYFKQEIDAQGNQIEVYLQHDFAKMPLRRVLDNDGNELQISVQLPGREVFARVWFAEIGRAQLLLLDSDIERNNPNDRAITHQLYGGDREMRISQEILLGIGGVRLLKALGIEPAVWHMNEGHVAFSTLERIHDFQQHGLTLAEAMEAVRQSTVFTTHTPVPAGNEAFSLPLMDKYFRSYCNSIHMNLHHLFELGLQTGPRGEKFFSMTVMALRLACRSNGVSALHGQVSQQMWTHIWPKVPHRENPIFSITNGIHTKTWLAPAMHELYREFLGPDWAERLADKDYWQKIDAIPYERLRETKRRMKEELFAFIREQVKAQFQRLGFEWDRINGVDHWLHPDTLTIGFARRFATYKRATLLLRDIERLNHIINNPDRPVQLIYAGKAHPADQLGQSLIRDIWHISQRPEFLGKIVILENYNMNSGRHLVQGVDIWLNNPRRPQEASGTSGQKVPINAGINFSVLDGWWPEAYDGTNGWKIGRDGDYENDGAQDYEDAMSLYDVLEHEIVPMYYGGDLGDGRSWEQFTRASMRSCIPVFNTDVMVRNYFTKMYKIAIDKSSIFHRDIEVVKAAVAERQRFRGNWPLVHFTAVHAHIDRSQWRPTVDIRTDLYIGELKAGDLRVELYCVNGAENDPVILPLEQSGSIAPHMAQFALRAQPEISSDADFRLRVIPQSPNFVDKHELGLIYWKEIE